MTARFSENGTTVSINGKIGRAPFYFIEAIKSVATSNGIEIKHLGWDGAYTSEVELSESHKTEVQSEMKRIGAQAEALNAKRCVSRICPACGTRSGTYTTSRTVCDDCA